MMAKDHSAKIVKELQERDWEEKAFVVHDLDGYNLMIAQPSGQVSSSDQ